MRVYASDRPIRLPFETDALVSMLFETARDMLRIRGKYSPTLITLFRDNEGYIGHYHILAPDEGEGKVLPVSPIIEQEKPDAFVLVTLANVTTRQRTPTKQLIEGDFRGHALTLTFSSQTESRVVYQMYRRRRVGGKPVIVFGKTVKSSTAPRLEGFGEIKDWKDRLSYIR